MGEISLETVRQMFQCSTQVQLLFDGNRLVDATPEAQRSLPGLMAYDLEQLFGENAQLLNDLRPTNSLQFSASLLGQDFAISVTWLDRYMLVTATPNQQAAHSATMLSLAEHLRRHLGSMMAMSPNLFFHLSESEDPDMLKWASALNQEFFHLLRLTRNLETFTGSRSLQRFNQVDLDRWVADLASDLEPLLAEADRALSFQVPGERCQCMVDEGQLQWAVLALISNAVKFTRPGGTIRMTLQKHGSRLRLCVQDDGKGIPADQMGLIFQRSEHRGAIPDSRYGVGLGLSLVRQIVEAHGGRLMLESQEGVGTSAYISLNAQESSTLSLRAPVRLPQASDGYNPLLVALADVLPPRVFDTRGT